MLKERLFNAVNDGELSVAQACLDANAGTSLQLFIDVVDEDGNTPLSEAACYGENELVEFFLSRGAHPDSRNELGRTPIWRACYNGHFEVVKLLLENGADKSIASNTGDAPGKHGTAETKALIAAWDPEETVKLKQARNLGGWQPQKEKKGRAKPVVQAELTPLQKMLQSGEEPAWPLKVGLRELPLALSAAHDFGKVGLVVANGLEEVERYLLYSCEGLIDGKQLIGEVFIKKNQSLEEAKEMLRDLLLSSMETHGVGVSLHIRMGDSACDLQRFCGDGMFPAEVFGGPQRWSNEEVLRHFPHSGISLQKDFQLVISTRFNLEDCRLHLADKIPYFEELAFIEIDPESVS